MFNDVTKKQLGLVHQAKESVNELDNVLIHRSGTHGDYRKNAEYTMDVLGVLNRYGKLDNLPNEMRLALTMIAHKMGRIVNGDATFEDHWVDIQGYSQCVLDAMRNLRKRAQCREINT